MKQVIEVNGIKLYAHHGCLQEEALIGGHYIVDIALLTDFQTAAETDELNQTVDYVAINQIVKKKWRFVPNSLNTWENGSICVYAKN
jgi:dihydroneopterin aldolase